MGHKQGPSGKPRCLLLPGMLCSEDLWSSQVDALKLVSEIRVVVPTGATIGEMVDEVLDAADGSISIAGLSLGGIVAMAAAIKAPERIQRLAVFSATASGPRADQRRGWTGLSQRTKEGLPVGAAADELWPTLISERNQDNQVLRSTVREMAESVGAPTFLQQLSAQQSRRDQHAQLSSITCPTSIVAAAQDRLVPVAAMEKIATCIPRAEFHVLHEAGHLSALEAPEEVSRLLADWMVSPI